MAEPGIFAYLCSCERRFGLDGQICQDPSSASTSIKMKTDKSRKTLPRITLTLLPLLRRTACGIFCCQIKGKKGLTDIMM